ncbi:fuselloviral integrase [Acidianus hospitalis W1]|uniref:Fuselloviral integrase n=1 Tax=Acidianus hospitalis (strain W1) TaxID=933801 RepID=F4B976_ACIHW|nr:fuselloviral integrase [Acidianus hospitalis W1]
MGDMPPQCSGRDLNPGHRLERPAYLTGLYYRSEI